MNAIESLPADEIHFERFCTSSSEVDDLMEPAEFCLRISHPEQRCRINELMVHQFKSKLRGAASLCPANRIFNYAETSWKCSLGPQKVTAEKN
jgi:hypothetical protein